MVVPLQLKTVENFNPSLELSHNNGINSIRAHLVHIVTTEITHHLQLNKLIRLVGITAGVTVLTTCIRRDFKNEVSARCNLSTVSLRYGSTH